MKKIIIIISLCLCTLSSAYAGKTAKIVGIGLTGYILHTNKDKIANYAIQKIKSKRAAKSIAKKIANQIIQLENNGSHKINDLIKTELLERSRINLDRYNLPLMILEELKWIKKDEKSAIKHDNKIFNDAVVYLTHRVDDNLKWNPKDQDEKCNDPNSSDDLLIIHESYESIKSKLFDVNHFGNFNIEDSDENIAYDHIPDHETIIEFMKRKKGKKITTKQFEAIKNNAIAITISSALHSASRTYGEKNSKLKFLDSQDLFITFFQDYAVHFLNLEYKKNRKYTQDGFFGKREKTLKLEKAREDLIKGMTKHFEINMELCLYNTIYKI